VAPITVSPVEEILAVVVGCIRLYFAASGPLISNPVVMITLPEPTFLFTKVPVAPEETR